jgi:hypothetical protein
MTYAVILAAAAAVWFWPQILANVQKLRGGIPKDIPPRYFLSAAMLAGVLVAFAVENYRPESQPMPGPPEPPVTFSLRGKFIGPTASADASTFGALCDELAAVLEYDAEQAEPRIKTGAAIEDLRVAAREARLRGVSLGARQPHARDAVKAYLDQAAGTSGGPLSLEQRAAWVSAFRDVARAANDAAR